MWSVHRSSADVVCAASVFNVEKSNYNMKLFI